MEEQGERKVCVIFGGDERRMVFGRWRPLLITADRLSIYPYILEPGSGKNHLLLVRELLTTSHHYCLSVFTAVANVLLRTMGHTLLHV
jgi:hypothetical protein